MRDMIKNLVRHHRQQHPPMTRGQWGCAALVFLAFAVAIAEMLSEMLESPWVHGLAVILAAVIWLAVAGAILEWVASLLHGGIHEVPDCFESPVAHLRLDWIREHDCGRRLRLGDTAE